MIQVILSALFLLIHRQSECGRMMSSHSLAISLIHQLCAKRWQGLMLLFTWRRSYTLSILHRICRSPDGAQQEFERYLSELLDIVGAGADFYLGAESVEIPVEPAAVQQLNADVAIEVFLLVVQELIVDFPESYGDRCSELSLISTVLNTELSELLQRHSEAV